MMIQAVQKVKHVEIAELLYERRMPVPLCSGKKDLKKNRHSVISFFMPLNDSASISPLAYLFFRSSIGASFFT